MDYGGLWNAWLQAHQQPTPKDMKTVKGHKGYTKPYFMSPEDMMKVLNAFSPYDLYNKPDSTPQDIGYQTSAFNINNFENSVGIPKAILLAASNPKSGLTPIHSVSAEKGNYNDIPKKLLSYIAQAIYEHEYGHEIDPRLSTEAKNYGYTTRYGLPGNIGGREAPAIKQEDMFWDALLNRR